jgi:hypothetical protein
MTNNTFTPSISASAAAENIRSAVAHQGEHPTVYVVQRHVSDSGMLRRLSFLVVTERGELQDITTWVAAVRGKRVTEFRGSFTVKVEGAGMNMHWYAVYSLSAVLYSGQGVEHPEDVLRYETV